MSTRRLLAAGALLSVALGMLLLAALGCGSTSPAEEGDVVSFEIGGQGYVFHSNTDNVSAGIAGENVTLSASGPAGRPSLSVSLFAYHGAASYTLGAGGSGFARLVVDEVVYETTGPEGTGSLTVSSAGCTTKTVYDPVTGITGPLTTCHLAGTFGFVAVSEAGERLAVTGGRFSATSMRGGN